jgi:hypothetical protein
MNKGMKALKKAAPEVAKKMGYGYGGMTKKKDMMGMVRARDENGHFIADDPSTPDVNEAWVVKTVKKVVKK